MKKFVLLIGGLFAAMNSYAASYSVSQVTDDSYYNEYEKMNEKGDVVWASWVNAADPGWTVFEYDAETKVTTQVSSNNAFFISYLLFMNCFGLYILC